MENSQIISMQIFAAALYESTSGAAVRQQAGPLRARFRVGGLLVTGPTGTNVMGIQIVLLT